MRERLQLVGKRFGRLVVVSKDPVNNPSNNSRWNCVCDCGKYTTVVGSKLINGHTSSCGCLYEELKVQFGKRFIKHGLCGSQEYGIWCNIKARCLNKDSEYYDRYGGRGITICDRWKDSFQNFYADMGPRPSPMHSIDRKNNNGNYEPDNCRWATQLEQANNRRSNHFYEHNGISKTLAQWSREYNIAPHKLYKRLIVRGWSFERAINTT